MKSYALIVNPVSGRGRALHKAEALREGLAPSSSVEILRTTHRGAASDLAAHCVGRVDRVVAVGGDGTLNEVVSGLMSAEHGGGRLPELGFLSAGTANAAMKAFGLTSDPVVMAEALPTAASRSLDVGLVRHDGGERAFLLWFGAGWDAVVIHTLNATRSGFMGVSGLFGHTPALLRAVSAYAQPPITAVVDGQSFGGYSTVVVANVGVAAFGGMIAEGVDPGDGRFDVVGVPHVSALGAMRLAFQMMTSSLTRSPRVRYGRGAEVTLPGEGDVPFHLDGEAVGALPATVRLLPGAVRLLAT